MEKAAAILLIVSLGLLFAGAVSAHETPSVDVTVLDENGDNVTAACIGDEVSVDIVASANDEYITDPWVIIHITPSNGLTLNTEDSVMWNGIGWIYNDDPVSGGFLHWSDQAIGWVWLIGNVLGPMEAGNTTELIIPAQITDTGQITLKTNFDDDYQATLASDTYSFLSIPCYNCHPGCSYPGETIPMQNTGAPITIGILAVLSIIGGIIYSKI